MTNTWFADGSAKNRLVQGENSADIGGRKRVVPLTTEVESGLESAPSNTKMGEGISMMNQPKLPLMLNKLSNANRP